MGISDQFKDKAQELDERAKSRANEAKDQQSGQRQPQQPGQGGQAQRPGQGGQPQRPGQADQAQRPGQGGHGAQDQARHQSRDARDELDDGVDA
nr:hypothetical protein OH820_13030 [Streptomyces sp. NBC_00857]